MSSSTIPIPPLLPGDLEVSAFQVTRPKVIKGAVTQTISNYSTVTLNAASGTITMTPSTITADNSVDFEFINSYIGIGSTLLVSIQNYSGTTGLPNIGLFGTFDGGAVINLQNSGTTSLNGSVTVSFLVV